jgi:hypothetical protein
MYVRFTATPTAINSNTSSQHAFQWEEKPYTTYFMFDIPNMFYNHLKISFIYFIKKFYFMYLFVYLFI